MSKKPFCIMFWHEFSDKGLHRKNGRYPFLAVTRPWLEAERDPWWWGVVDGAGKVESTVKPLVVGTRGHNHNCVGDVDHALCWYAVIAKGFGGKHAIFVPQRHRTLWGEEFMGQFFHFWTVCFGHNIPNLRAPACMTLMAGRSMSSMWIEKLVPNCNRTNTITLFAILELCRQIMEDFDAKLQLVPEIMHHNLALIWRQSSSMTKQCYSIGPWPKYTYGDVIPVIPSWNSSWIRSRIVSRWARFQLVRFSSMALPSTSVP